jgi:hypothetical protein
MSGTSFHIEGESLAFILASTVYIFNLARGVEHAPLEAAEGRPAVESLCYSGAMTSDIEAYHNAQTDGDRAICDLLRREIDVGLPRAASKIWHAHPVWFLEGNPTVGYSKQRAGMRLMFWSGADFDEPDLKPGTGKFKDASAFYASVSEVNIEDLHRWLEKSQRIQWDYKNLIKRKGKLERQ